MAQNDVYEQLADMLDEEDFSGVPKTPELMKILHLQFTLEEARLAVQIRLTGGRLDEISEKTGVKRDKLKKILNTMADKGTIFIQPEKEDPKYKVVGLAGPGITETGLWGNVRFPYTVELGKALHQLGKDWVEQRLCKVGVSFVPVWPAVAALPSDALPSESIAESIREAGHWSVSACPCRLSHWLADPGNHCDHMLQTCVHTGDLSRWTVEHGMARELTYDEAVELLRKCNENGLVHTMGTRFLICNCCNDCCMLFHGQQLGLQILKQSPFVAEINEETCNACKTCAERCPVGAIQVAEYAVADRDLCIGCSVCVPTCKTGSAKLVRRPEAQQSQALA